MVTLDSYDSEGPLTPETDDSTEVRPAINPSTVFSASAMERAAPPSWTRCLKFGPNVHLESMTHG